MSHLLEEPPPGSPQSVQARKEERAAKKKKRQHAEGQAQLDDSEMTGQSEARAKLENLMRDPTGEIAELALLLDVLDGQIRDEKFIAYTETRR